MPYGGNKFNRLDLLPKRNGKIEASRLIVSRCFTVCQDTRKDLTVRIAKRRDFLSAGCYYTWVTGIDKRHGRTTGSADGRRGCRRAGGAEAQPGRALDYDGSGMCATDR